MGLFSRSPKDATTALIVDVGSGSVGLSIIYSKQGALQPEVVWSYREFCLIKDTPSTSHTLKEINTTIVNAFLELGSDGIKALANHEAAPAISDMQVSIAAPWTYTVTKTVHYGEEHAFELSDTLIEELAAAASKKALEAVTQQSLLSASGLVTIDNQTVGVLANDYALESYDDITTKDVTILHLTAITHTRIIETLEEVRSKVIPRAEMTAHSFMYVFYDVLKRHTPDTTDCCLIDITNEATEIGIIRDNILRHTSHVPYGAYTLAREIAAVSGLLKEEAYAFLRGGGDFILQKLTAAKQATVLEVVAAYEAKVAELFKQTGDTLAIPKTIYLHRDADSEPFFLEHIATAAKQATNMQHTIQPITPELLQNTDYAGDTAMILSATFYHEHSHKND